MPFKPGAPGRPVGSVNKISAKFADTMAKHGINIAEEMNEGYLRALTDKDFYLAHRYLCEMAKYVYPTLKAVEHTTNDHLKDMSPEQKLEALEQAVELMKLQLKKE
jgi:hypothetical protein